MQVLVRKDAGVLQRAYALLEIKTVNEEKREIDGIATTPTPDRYGDIVEPKGAEFKLPIPLLWQHNSREPVGEVVEAKVGADGIRIKARFAKIDEPGKLKDRLDEAWQSVKAKLVKGLSIGFTSLEDSRIKDTYSIHFLRWEWLELSVVTIAANADATITALKTADQRHLAATGKTVAKVVRLDKPAGASASLVVKPKGNAMTIKEQIAASEAKRAANAARMQALMDAAGAKGETLDEAGEQEYDGLEAENTKFDSHIARLKKLEVANAAAVVVVKQPDGEDPARAASLRDPYGALRVTSNVPKGMAFARLVKAYAAAKASSGQFTPLQFAEGQKSWKDTTPQVADYLKTAVAGGTSTGSAWADDIVYAQDLQGEFIELLYPMTILGRLKGLRRVPFNIRVGSQTSGGTGYWIGEGKPIPVSKLQTDNVTLAIAKAAGLMVITKELARLSSPSAEALVRTDLLETVTKFLDQQFIDPNFGPVTATGAPGAVTYGIPSTQVRQASGTTAAALRADFAALMDPLFTANVNTMDAAWVMSPFIAMKIGMINTSLGTREFPDINMNGGSLFGLPVITSMSAYVSGSPDYGHLIVLVKPSDIFLADEGGVEVDASDSVAIQMDDAPTNETPTPTATSLVSMWQTESVAIKLVRYINWKRRRATAVGYIRSAAYADA